MDEIVLATAWGAAALYAAARIVPLIRPKRMYDSLLPVAGVPWWLDLMGCGILASHFAFAYGVTHHGSHQEALAHAALRTKETVGWEFSSGLYFNFVAIAVWGYLLVQRRFLVQGKSTPTGVGKSVPSNWRMRLDKWGEWFLAFIVFNATFVFAQGPLRWAALMLFGTWGVLWYRRAWDRT